MMNSQGGALHFDSDINDKKFFESLERQEKRAELFALNVVKSFGKIDDAFLRTGTLLSSGAFAQGVNTARGNVLQFQNDFISRNRDVQRSIDELAAKMAALGRGAVNNNNPFGKLKKDAETSVNEISQLFGRLSGVIAGYLSIQAAQTFVNDVIKIRTEFENLDVAFTTILRSKEDADKLMAEVVQYAATTPFNLTDVAKATKQLLAYGVAAGDITDELTTLGNIAAGVSQPIGEIAYLYGTLKTQGRAYAMDIRQFTGRGIPIIAELANVLGVAKDEVMALVEAGKVGFPEVQKAFQNMTGSGGAFFNLMQKQSTTTGGRIANLKDKLDLMYNSIGAANSGIINDSISGLNVLVDNYEKIIDVLTVLIATYGTYRAALALTAVVQAALVSQGFALGVAGAIGPVRALTAAEALRAIGLGLLAKAQAALNAVMLLNPYAIAAAAVVGLTVAMYALHEEINLTSIAQDRLNAENKKAADQADALKNKVRELTQVLQDKNATDYQQNLAFEQLQKLYPKAFANMTKDAFLKLEIADAQKKINEENDRYSVEGLEKRFKASESSLNSLKKQLTDLKNANVGGDVGREFQRLSEEIEIAEINTKKLGEELKKQQEDYKISLLTDDQKLKYYNKQKDAILKQKEYFNDMYSQAGQLQDIFSQYTLKNLDDQLNIISAKITAITTGGGLSKVRTVGMIDADIANARDSQKNTSTRAQYKKLEDQIKAFELEKQKITGKATKSELKGINDLKNARIRALEAITDAETKANRKSLSDDEEKLQKARDAANELRELAKKGKLGAGSMARIDAIEAKTVGFVQYDIDTEKLIREIDAQKEVYANYEDFKVKISKDAADQRYANEIKLFSSFEDYLKNEISKVDTLDKASMTGSQQDRLTKLKQIEKDYAADKKAQRDKDFADALVASMGFEEKIRAINIKYDKIAIDLGKSLTNSRSESLLKERDLAIEAAKQEAFEKTEIYKKLSEETILYTKKEVEARIEALKKLIDSGQIPSDILPKLKSELSNLEFGIQFTVDKLNLENLQSEYDKLLNALNTTDKDTGINLVPEEEKKKVLKRIAEILAEIKKLDPNNTGSPISKFADGVKKNFEFLKGDTIEFANGLSNGLSQISGSISELGNALGGADTQAGFLLGTIGSLVGIGADAAGAVGSFASGDIVGGVTKTIKAVAGLFSIGKKVKEMNAAARKEIKDFYDSAYKGEKEYESLLRNRERQLLSLNAIGLKGINEQTSALQRQRSEIDKSYQETLKRLQAEQKIISVEYTHGTWFRKAKTEYQYGSLSGITDFNELERLYTSGVLTDGAKKLFEELRRLKEEGLDVEEALKGAAEAAAEIATGTTVSDLSKRIIDNLRAGKTDLKSEMDDWSQIIRDALLSQFEDSTVREEMKGFYNRLALAAQSGGETTKEEIEAAKQDYIDTLERIRKAFEIQQQVTGVDLKDPLNKDSQRGVQANIKSLTQDTGVALEGLIRGLFDIVKRKANFETANSVPLAKQLEYMDQHISLTTEIRDNTRAIAQNGLDQINRLDSMVTKLTSIDKKTETTKSIRDSAGTPI